MLLAPPHLAPRRTGAASWAEAMALPLSLLTRNMRNRRFLDGIFEAHVGRAPQPVLETNDFTAALIQVARGATATIVPELLADVLPLGGERRPAAAGRARGQHPDRPPDRGSRAAAARGARAGRRPARRSAIARAEGVFPKYDLSSSASLP